MSSVMAASIVVLLSMIVILMILIIFYIKSIVDGERLQKFGNQITISNIEELLFDTFTKNKLKKTITRKHS